MTAAGSELVKPEKIIHIACTLTCCRRLGVTNDFEMSVDWLLRQLHAWIVTEEQSDKQNQITPNRKLQTLQL